jgi:hypothetical protein
VCGAAKKKPIKPAAGVDEGDDERASATPPNLSLKEACELFRDSACYPELRKIVTKNKHFPLEKGIKVCCSEIKAGEEKSVLSRLWAHTTESRTVCLLCWLFLLAETAVED